MAATATGGGPMAAKAPLLLVPAFALLLPGCTSGDTGRFVKSQAFEACRNLDGDARARCLDREEDRAAEQLAKDNERCLAEIEAQRERAAMRRGEQAGRPDSAAADGC